MRALTSNLRPAQGFSHYFHLGLTSFLPAIIFVLIRIEFAQLALALILLSKWRMFVVRPRYWLANIIANAVDIIVGLSVVIFMSQTASISTQLVWAAAYGVWLVFLKPGSSVLLVSLQALTAQILGLVAIYSAWQEAPIFGMVLATWVISYLSARHFFTNFDDEYGTFYAHTWGYFTAAVTWVLGHWLLFYGAVPQPALLLSVMGFCFAGMYYLNDQGKLTKVLKRQFVFIMFAIITVVLAFSDWGDKTV